MRLSLAAFVLIPTLASGADVPAGFDGHFIDRTMRVDYYHVGNAEEEFVTLDRVWDQGIWAGSRTHLVDPFDNGRYAVKVYDLESGDLIFSRGFDCTFGDGDDPKARIELRPVGPVERVVPRNGGR